MGDMELATDSLREVSQRLEDVAERMRLVARESSRLWAEANDEWLTPEEAAEHLKLSREAFEKLVRREEVPRFYISERVIRYSKRELNGWLRKR